MYELDLFARYCNRNGKPFFGIVERTVQARNPPDHYRGHPWIPDHRSGDSLSEEGARERLDTAQRVIRFMDATGLKHSRAWRAVFGIPGYPPGFDHTLVWQRDRCYIVTTEPYRGANDPRPWLNENGWRWLCLPELGGMWNPPSTVLYLCSPAKRGMDLEALAAMVASNTA